MNSYMIQIYSLFAVLLISCGKSVDESQGSESGLPDKHSVTRSHSDCSQTAISEMISRKKVSKCELISILDNFRDFDDSRFKNLTSDQKFDLLRILVDQMDEESSDWDDTYKVLTGLQTMCLPNKREVWKDWIDEQTASSINWVF